jgi:hypothetical protein
MPLFRKRPVVIEARQFIGTNGDGFELADWCGGSYTNVGGDDLLYINTLEGKMLARATDYVIKGVEGEFYPCRADIFEQTYEPADEPEFDGLDTMSDAELAATYHEAFTLRDWYSCDLISDEQDRRYADKGQPQ